MKLWLILVILSPITYLVVDRSVRHKTTTPVWLCWLVIMLPSCIWTVWTYIFGEEQPLPLAVFLLPLIVCPLLYGWLVQRGKIENTRETTVTTATKTEPKPLAMAKTATESTSAPRPINDLEETTLRNCFPWNVYYLQNIDYRPQAIFCRGKLKTIPEEAYQEIKSNVEKAFGDRFFLIFQESFRGKPFFALVPNPQAKAAEKGEAENDLRVVFALVMFFITLLTTTIAGVSIDATLSEELFSNPSLLLKGLSYSLPLLLIIAVQKFSHYFVAAYYKIRTTLPYFMPFPFLLDNFAVGTLGAFSQRRSPIPHRKGLFDLAIISSLSGLLLIIPVLFWGLSLSEITPLEESSIFNLQAQDPRLSLFFSLIAKIVLGSSLTPDMGIQLHPIAVAGCVGLFITAINLMPIGQLDGGHIVHAVFGQKMAIAVGQITRILAVLFAVIHPYFWIWAIIMWLIPLIDQPALNDVTELDNTRDFLGLFSLALLVMMILPLPSAIASLLNM
ncbi:site-2 protease family protein [Waterburya agarophytonicola K14]|uniref:Site-2 protease family protein n=1 Tax=Waterburya agarophytonicola KI4 TaxID=2874699 RepID=A0A964BSI2_9CYAN|nr:site-2 protease family protein [Waterburya agarophytonicola]MCC0177020.1 site-2 protease family protein [Waterburya agarophytonicola KI4]